jgi:hypothetical protein
VLSQAPSDEHDTRARHGCRAGRGGGRQSDGTDLTGAEPGEADAVADVVLRKPIDPLELVQTVRSLIGEAPGTL